MEGWVLGQADHSLLRAARRAKAWRRRLSLTLALALLSGIGLGKLASWVWTPVLLFTGTIALPAIVLTPGTPVLVLGGFAVTTSTS